MCSRYVIKAAVLSALLTSAAQAQTYTFRTYVGDSPMVVSDGAGDNLAPIANAGPDQNVASSATVTLDGASSSDPDPDDTLTFGWVQDSGSTVTLSDASASQPTFTAPT